MGNAASCAGVVHQHWPTGRVMRPDGIIEEFDNPIRVSKLASLYPGYLVVHCSTCTSLGERRKISVMEVKDRLIPGQSYVLYAIPDQYKQSYYQSLRTVSQSDVPSGFGSADMKSAQLIEMRNTSSRRRKKRSRIKVVLSCLAKILMTGSPVEPAARSQGALVPLLRSDRKVESSYLKNSRPVKQSFQKKLVLPLEPYIWRPTLDCIPESPSANDDIHTRRPPFSIDELLGP